MSVLDTVTLAVIQSGLQQVCNEMDLAFVRAAFSPVMSEALDRSDGIYHGDTGELIAQGELGLPVFVGTKYRPPGAADSAQRSGVIRPGWRAMSPWAITAPSRRGTGLGSRSRRTATWMPRQHEACGIGCDAGV